MNTKFVILFIMVSTAVTQVRAAVQCRGSDGPNPLFNISEQFQTPADKIETVKGVKDFFHWPGKNTVVYRNYRDDVYQVNLMNNKNAFMKRGRGKLSRIKDRFERYVLTDRNNYYFDSEENKNWDQFEMPESVTHLFWNGPLMHRYLYSLSNVIEMRGGKQELKFYRSTPNVKKPFTCILPATVQDEAFYVGQGHIYPKAFLYKVFEYPGGNTLKLYTVDLAQQSTTSGHICNVEEVQKYNVPIPGVIQTVYQMAGKDSFAVVTHLSAVKKVFWHSPRRDLECIVGKTDDPNNVGPFILNTNQPIIGYWTKDGVGLIMPDAPKQPKEATLLKGLSTYPITKEDLWLTDDGKKLFVSARGEDQIVKDLYEMDFGSAYDEKD